MLPPLYSSPFCRRHRRLAKRPSLMENNECIISDADGARKETGARYKAIYHCANMCYRDANSLSYHYAPHGDERRRRRRREEETVRKRREGEEDLFY